MELSGQLYDPANSPPVKSHMYPLNRRLSGLHSQSGRYEEKKNLLLFLGIELQPFRQKLAAKPNELSRLHHNDSILPKNKKQEEKGKSKKKTNTSKPEIYKMNKNELTPRHLTLIIL
jgi:hypothetical protein